MASTQINIELQVVGLDFVRDLLNEAAGLAVAKGCDVDVDPYLPFCELRTERLEGNVVTVRVTPSLGLAKLVRDLRRA